MEMKASSGGGRGGTGLGSVQLDDILSRVFVGRLSPAIAAELIEGAPSVYYPPGSIIFSPGNGTTAALVVSGLLRYYMAGSDGRFFQAEDGIRGLIVTGVQTCALPI